MVRVGMPCAWPTVMPLRVTPSMSSLSERPSLLTSEQPLSTSTSTKSETQE